MESPGHRENILDPLHRRVSLGIARHRGVWLVQHFEGDYVGYEQLLSINDGILTLRGNLRNGARMADAELLAITYYPPPHTLTPGQLFRTYCYTSGHFVAAVWREPGFTMETTTHTPCPDPYEVSPDAEIPSSLDEIEKIGMALRRVEEVTVLFTGIDVQADRWDLRNDNTEFDIWADLGAVIARHGPGLYTIEVMATLEGFSEVVSTYTIWQE